MYLATTIITAMPAPIRAITGDLAGSPLATKYATQAKITTLTAAIELFDHLQRQPRTSIAGSATKRRELVTEVADLMEQFADLDDLVVQFEPLPSGVPAVPGRTPEAIAAFIADWQRLRKIIPAGHGPSEEEPATPPTP